MTHQIEDFGQKIGGSRKELFVKKGLYAKDLERMTPVEQEEFVKRDVIFPKPKYEEMVENGMDRFIVYLHKEIRLCIYPNPKLVYRYGSREVISRDECLTLYVETIHKIMAALESLKDYSDLQSFNNFIQTELFIEKSDKKYHFSVGGFITVKEKIFSILSQESIAEMLVKMKKKFFCIPKDRIAEETIKQRYQVNEYDGQTFRYFEEDHNSKNPKVYIIMNISNGRFFYCINKNELKKESIWKAGINFVIDKDGRTICMVGDKASCQKFIQEKVAEMEQKLLLGKENNTLESKRKKRFVPAQLSKVTREGEELLNGRSITGDMMMKAFKFRAGEFGEWLSDNDRQYSLNYSFEAFYDLATIMNIDLENISLNGQLAIAFGARGRGSALAHYETGRQVINLTKMRGAGSLCHEWAHALDHMLAKLFCEDSIHLATEIDGHEKNKLPASMLRVIGALRYKPDSRESTKYYLDSERFDTLAGKTTHGYWRSRPEMFARAFENYIDDKLIAMNLRNDYLCGHSQSYYQVVGDDVIYAFPIDKEREFINSCFDELILELKKKGFFKEMAGNPKERVKRIMNYVPAIKIRQGQKSLNGSKNTEQISFF